MALEEDILNEGFRREVTNGLFTEENKRRKQENRKRSNMMKGSFLEILQRELQKEYAADTADRMRKVVGINFVERIVNEKASIYKKEPKRVWTGELNDAQKEQLDDLYRQGAYNVWLKQANKLLELQDQDLLQIIPRNGKLDLRALGPQFYDVIPRQDDPTKAFAYILSVEDPLEFYESFRDSTERHRSRDGQDLPTADMDDSSGVSAAKSQEQREKTRLIWWTDQFNFTTDGHGKLVGEAIPNPIGVLPFIDVANPVEKDFKYYVYNDSKLIRFQIELGKTLSDKAEAIKMQGHAYGVLVAEEKPSNFKVGPAEWLFLQLNADHPELKPDFEFISPGADIPGMISSIEQDFAMYLSSEGLDPKEIGGKLESTGFASGIERLLAMIDRFEASADTIDLFKHVEDQLIKLVVKWNNILIGQDELLENAGSLVQLPDDTGVNIIYATPESVQTKTEAEDSAIKLKDAGGLTEVDFIMRIHDFDEDAAKEYIKKRDAELKDKNQLTIVMEDKEDAKKQDLKEKDGADS